MKSLLVYKFTCATCSSCYIGETCRHFKTRIEEHIKKDNKSHIFKHLHSTATCLDSFNLHSTARCFDSNNSLCFNVIDEANCKFDIRIKNTLHINWRKPKLKAQQNLLALSLSLELLFPLLFSVLLLSVHFFFLLLFSFSFLQFSFIYCFRYLYANYWHLLLS